METTLNSKMLDFQKKVGIVKKDSKNPHFKNTYASLTQILSEVKPILTECGLVLIQPISLEGVGTTIIDFETGEKLETIISLPLNLSPQQLGSAITYFRRYTLASLLALEIDDDDATMASKPTPIVVKELTLAEKIEYAKSVLIVATKENLGSLWKTLSVEMQENEDVKKFGAELTSKLGIKK